MKKGITLIEMLVTISILSIFVLMCYPYTLRFTKQVTNINELQNYSLTSVKFINKINEYFVGEIIYVVNDDKISIKTKNHSLFINEHNEILIDNVDTNFTLENLIIENNCLVLNVLYDDSIKSIFIRGDIVENSKSFSI